MRIYELFEFRLFEDRIDFLRNQFKDIPENDFNQIVEADPTKNKIYTQWLLNLYKDRKKNLMDNLSYLTKHLIIFDRWKHKLPKKDINQYTLNELIKTTDSYENKTEKLRNQYQISDSDFNKIVEADPTENKIYTKWLLDIYKHDKRLIEDLPKATRYLKIYDKKKSQLGTTIDYYTGLSDLYRNAIERFDKRKDITRQWDDNIDDQIKVFYKGPEGQILIPLTKEASIYLGQGTQWCTAWTTNKNQFEYYNRKGPLYCIFTNDGRKYQFHLQDIQLKDEVDGDVNVKEFNKKYPWVFDKIWPTEKDKLIAVNQNGDAIKYIQNPSEELQLAAVTNNCNSIYYIENPSEEVQLAALTQDITAIGYIKNPTEKVKEFARSLGYWNGP